MLTSIQAGVIKLCEQTAEFSTAEIETSVSNLRLEAVKMKSKNETRQLLENVRREISCINEEKNKLEEKLKAIDAEQPGKNI